jgi:DNA-binding transcriptional ArsR family regulator
MVPSDEPLLDPSVDPDEEPETLDPTLFEMQASFCRTMGHPHRLMILYVLKECEMCVGDIAGRLRVSQPSISQHLSAMRSVGMVSMRREGQFVYYRLADESISQACEMVRGILTRSVHARSAQLGGKE